MTEFKTEVSNTMDQNYMHQNPADDNDHQRHHHQQEEEHQEQIYESHTNGSVEGEALEPSASSNKDMEYCEEEELESKHRYQEMVRYHREQDKHAAAEPQNITKDSIMAQQSRSPVIATNVSVPGLPLVTKPSEEQSSEHQKVITRLSDHLLASQDDSQESIGTKHNEQTGTEEESSADGECQLPTGRVILHHAVSKPSLSSHSSSSAIYLQRSSPSSVTAPVICMGPSSNLVLPYDIPRGQGLPPVSTIIRSTSMARYDRANLHSMNTHHHHMGSGNMHNEARTDSSNLRNMHCFSPHRSVVVTASSSGISSSSLARMSLDGDHCRLIQHTSSPSPPSPTKENLLVEMPNSHHEDDEEQRELSEEIDQENMDGSDYEQADIMESIRQRYIANSHLYTENLKDYAACLPMNVVGGGQHQTRITPEMAEMINSMVQRSGLVHREDGSNDLMTEIPESSIHSSPSGLIISPHQSRNNNLQRLVISNCTSLSSDETSDGSSPLLSVDSDMECKVHDLRASGIKKEHHHHHLTEIRHHSVVLGQSVLQGIPRGVITSALSNSSTSMQLCSSEDQHVLKSNKTMTVIPELMDTSGEAQDLSSHRNKMHCENNVLMTSEEHSSPSSPLQHHVPTSALPSFLSSLTSSSLASLSASLTSTLAGLNHPMGMPITTTSTSFVPLTDSMNPSPTCISSPQQPLIMSGPSVVKLETNRNTQLSPTCSSASTVTSLYSTLPSMQSISSYIKQEIPSPSSGSLPPFPVISKHHGGSSMSTSILSSQSTHPIMSVVTTTTAASSAFMGSCAELPPYSSMRVSAALPPLNIPGASSSSDSPSPVTSGIQSDNSPVSLSSPNKKSDKYGDKMALLLQSKEDKDEQARKWCCIMCRNGSPCGLHPTHMQLATSSISPGALPSGDPAKPYQCTICGKNLASKNVFQLHMRSHSGEKPFRCNLCGHHFSQKTSLTRHMRSHTGERPFPCGVCGKRFADKERIKIHMRTHTGEKPFACEVCGKRFSQKSTVKRHMSVHTGEKPFKCEACGKGFANRGNLNAHAKTHANS